MTISGLSGTSCVHHLNLIRQSDLGSIKAISFDGCNLKKRRKVAGYAERNFYLKRWNEFLYRIKSRRAKATIQNQKSKN